MYLRISLQVTLTYPESDSPRTREVTGDWAAVLERLLYAGDDDALKLLLTFPHVKSVATQMVMNDVKRECIGLCSTKAGSLFSNTSADSLANWSPSAQEQELHTKAPTFLTFLECAGTPTKVASNTKKNPDVIRNGLMAAAGVLLKTRNKNMNSYQTMISLALKQGGAGEKTFRRLHSMSICDSYQVISSKLDEFSIGYDEPLKRWQQEMVADAEKERALLDKLANLKGEIASHDELVRCERELEVHNQCRHPGYQIVGDNVDMRIRVRHMTIGHQDQDIHHFNHLVIKNRVNAHHLPDDKPTCDPASFQPNMILPNAETNASLRSSWIVLIGRIIAKYLPELSWFKDHIPENIPHKHMTEAATRSEVVSMPYILVNHTRKVT